PLHYDPILGKVTAFGHDRGEALRRLTAALDQSLIHGVVSNLPFLRALVRSREVGSASFDTEWIERDFLAGFAALADAPVPDLALAGSRSRNSCVWRAPEPGPPQGPPRRET